MFVFAFVFIFDCRKTGAWPPRILFDLMLTRQRPLGFAPLAIFMLLCPYFNCLLSFLFLFSCFISHFQAAAALVAGGKAGGLEPFTVLVVSFFASKLLYSHTFREVEDDVQVK